jgi:hypothetical protein
MLDFFQYSLSAEDSLVKDVLDDLLRLCDSAVAVQCLSEALITSDCCYCGL